MKDEYGGKSIFKFVGPKSKKSKVNNNEKNTNKGHNAFIEFDEFKDTLFQKDILRHKVRGIKSKNHNLGTYEPNIKYLYHVLTISDIFSMMGLIH